MRNWSLSLVILVLAPAGWASPPEDAPSSKSLLRIVRADRDPEAEALVASMRGQTQLANEHFADSQKIFQGYTLHK